MMRYNEKVWRNSKELLGLLGLARRAGKVIWGKDRLRGALRRRRVHVLLLSSDVGSTVKAEMIRRASKAKIPCVELSNVDKVELGKALGKSSDVSVIGITDRSLAEKIMSSFSRGDDIGAQSQGL